MITILAVAGVVGVAVYDGGSPTRWAAAAEPRPANVPPISHEEADRPLGVPPRSTSSSASYRFTLTHPDGTPVAYDPCRPVHFVTRPTGAPPGGAELLAAAIAEVSRATGLTFVDDGTTSEAPSADRAPYQPDRYGQRWAPVLIAWQTPSDNPDFAAAVTGEAGSIPVAWSGHPRAYVTGTVQLDATKFTQMLASAKGKQYAHAIVLHELGHLVGLGHVTDQTQLMFPESGLDATAYAAGDLAGLARLGQGPCTPWL